MLDGADGATATVTAPYQATDCAGLRFAPRLEATVGARGQTRVGAHPPLRTVITVPAGQASTAVANVGPAGGDRARSRRPRQGLPGGPLRRGHVPVERGHRHRAGRDAAAARALTGPVALAVAATASPGSR